MEHIAEETGRVFNLQRMSLHDGPGIRTVIFLKGCNLRCFWCHNPESVRADMEIEYFPDHCIGCRLCEGTCPAHCHLIDREKGTHVYNRAGCLRCGKCAHVCPAGALQRVGALRAASDVVREALRDRPFFEQSGGGVTLSGGEPMLQSAFCGAILCLLRAEGVNTAMETALCYPFSQLEALLPLIDCLLVDFKHPNSDKHLQYVGQPNELIVENLRRLDGSGARYTVRIPVIPGVNDSMETFAGFDAVLSGLSHLSGVELMPYHAYGTGKLIALDRDAGRVRDLQPPSRDHLTKLAGALRGIPVSFRQGAKKITVNGGTVCET